MVPHWFRSPKALILFPILLLLLGAVACGPSEESDTAKTDSKMDTGSDTMKEAFDRMAKLRSYVDDNFSGRDWNLASSS